MLLVACSAGAAEVRPGVGLGLGAFPGIPSAPLVAPRLDLQVEGGDGYVAFVAAARFSTYLFAGSGQFAPTIECGARWHVTRRITVGLAIATGIAVLFSPDGGSVFLIGATIEPFTWSITRHHEVGLTISGLIPFRGQGAANSGPFFSALVLPAVGYTYRF